MNFETKIKEWVNIDNQIKHQHDKLKQLREEKNNLNVDLNSYIEKNELNNAIIQISDGSLKYNTLKSTQPLTLKYINGCLTNCITNPETVEQLMIYIKEHRDTKYTTELKRYYNK
jgi:hypothetical protein|tara:strand:- start:1288 stop:1632 length:345 start_codon:yes stop_codon:yes gene_type:complete